MAKHTFQSIRKECPDADSAMVYLLTGIAEYQNCIRNHSVALLVLMAWAIAAPPGWAAVPVALSVLCVMVIFWNLQEKIMFTGLLHQFELIGLMQPQASETSAADWLAYHLAERIQDEQNAIAAAEDAEAAADAAAVAAMAAWVAAVAEPAPRGDGEPVH